METQQDQGEHHADEVEGVEESVPTFRSQFVKYVIRRKHYKNRHYGARSTN